jgi:hypothetical protein
MSGWLWADPAQEADKAAAREQAHARALQELREKLSRSEEGRKAGQQLVQGEACQPAANLPCLEATSMVCTFGVLHVASTDNIGRAIQMRRAGKHIAAVNQPATSRLAGSVDTSKSDIYSTDNRMAAGPSGCSPLLLVAGLTNCKQCVAGKLLYLVSPETAGLLLQVGS